MWVIIHSAILGFRALNLLLVRPAAIPINIGRNIKRYSIGNVFICFSFSLNPFAESAGRLMSYVIKFLMRGRLKMKKINCSKRGYLTRALGKRIQLDIFIDFC